MASKSKSIEKTLKFIKLVLQIDDKYASKHNLESIFDKSTLFCTSLIHIFYL